MQDDWCEINLFRKSCCDTCARYESGTFFNPVVKFAPELSFISDDDNDTYAEYEKTTAYEEDMFSSTIEPPIQAIPQTLHNPENRGVPDEINSAGERDNNVVGSTQTEDTASSSNRNREKKGKDPDSQMGNQDS